MNSGSLNGIVFRERSTAGAVGRFLRTKGRAEDVDRERRTKLDESLESESGLYFLRQVLETSLVYPPFTSFYGLMNIVMIHQALTICFSNLNIQN